jgi:hypothetical protein
VGISGGLHLLEQLGCHEYMHEMKTIRNRGIDRPFLRVGEPPRYHKAQDRRELPVESTYQLLQLGMRLRVKSGLMTYAIATLARLGVQQSVQSEPPF